MGEAEIYFREQVYDSAKISYEFLLSKPLEPICQAQVHYYLGKSNSNLSAYRVAISHFHRAIDILSDQSEPKIKAKIYSALAYAHSKLGDFTEAYSNQLKALEIAEARQDDKNIYRAVYQIGNYAQNLRDCETALYHYQRVKELMKGDTVSERYAALAGAIGSVYVCLDDIDKGISYLKRSMELGAEHKNMTTVAYALGNLGEAYAQAGNLELAINFFGASIEEKEKLGDLSGAVGSKLELGHLWLKQKRYARAEATFLEATYRAREIGARVQILEGYEALKCLFEENGQYEKAYYYLDRYTVLKDSMLNERTLELIEEQKVIYENAEKEAEIRRLKDIQAQRDENDRLRSFIAALIFLFAVSLIAFGYRVNRKLSRKNESLAAFGKQLSLKNAELESFAHIASHDLREPLRTISSFTSLISRKYTDHLDEKAREYMGFIHNSVHYMQDMLEDLLNYARADQAEMELETVQTKELMTISLNNLDSQVKQKDAEIRIDWESLPELEIVPSQLVQLFQNLIGNAVKFSDHAAQPRVQVKCSPVSEDFYRFSVRDNGIGIAKEHQEKIFEMFSRLHSRKEYYGTGIGLATCRKIVDQYGGKIWVDSVPGEGATFHFTLPRSINKRSRTV